MDTDGHRIRQDAHTAEMTDHSAWRFNVIFSNSAISLWEEDISELRAALADLKTSGVTDLRAYIDGAPRFVRQAIHMVKVTDVNQASLQLFGAKSKADLIGPLDNVVKVDDPLLFSSFKEEIVAIAEGCRRHTGESSARTLDGRMLHLLIEVCIPAPDDPYPYQLASIIDITEQRRTAEALRASESRYRSLLENLGDGVVNADLEERFAYANPATGIILGVPHDTLPGRKLSEFFDEENYAVIRREIRKRERGEKGTYEVRARRPDGSLRLIRVTATPQYDARHVFIGSFTILHDITEQESIDNALLTLQRLESLGTLAGGIAHDFNNQLTGILGNISLAMEGADEAERRQLLKEAQEACLVAQSLAGQLLTFAASKALDTRVVDLRILLQEQCAFAVRGTNVKCAFDTGPHALPVRVDPQQFSQVMQNLVLNAVQAMTDGGIITVRATRETLGNEQIPSLPAGPYVRCTVSDNGPGISADTLQRIFDPFFTTKPTGRGLGLTMCHSIVSKHGGHICVQSTSDAGTTFAVLLPAATEKDLPSAEIPPALPDATAARNEGRVLIMDDEPSVVKVLTSMLRRLGYQSEAVVDGAQALEAYARAEKAGKPFDLVIMDMTIPGGMGGKEAVERLMARHPDARAIVSTGYSNSSDFEAYGFRGILSKPYRLNELSAVLIKVLRAPADSGHAT